MNSSGAITRQQYNKTSSSTTINIRSSGDKSGMYNSSEEIFSNGNHVINTDNITKSVTKTDKVASNSGNNITDTVGNDSKHTNGLDEGAYGSRTRIIGNPDVVNQELHKTADKLKSKIVAARSGFNDDRNDTDGGILSNLMSIPGNILNSVTAIDDDVAERR